MAARFPIFHVLMFSVLALVLSGCAETKLLSHYGKKVTWPGQQENMGVYKVGTPYKVEGVHYYPRETFSMVETGIASWYGPGFNGKKTANGEIYDQNELTAAHRTLQMPSLVRVTNLENGRSIVVRINDRGPFKRGRVIDLSKRGADLLGFIGKGTARVRLEVLEKESRQIAEAAKRGMDTSRLTMADLQKIDANTPQPVSMARVERGPQLAYNGSDLPESLQTPTITVEELEAPGKPANNTSPPVWREPPRSAVMPAPKGHLQEGRYMPDPVVTQQPAPAATGLFVQAGSFAVKDNANRLADRLRSIAPTIVEPVTVQGRQLYRVKLGPFQSVDEADRVLSRVIGEGGSDTARVVRH